ncbi:MAG TPA: ABC transporter ATP-binding protein [Myxococcota bacterium]|nr:ABC transporter ATP-binding protein [Myxococcota bacterium]
MAAESAQGSFEERKAPSEGLRQRPMLRLFAYARPYLGLILVTILLSSLDSGARYVRAWMIKPVLDDIAIPAVGLGHIPVRIPGVGKLLGRAENPPAAADATAAAQKSAQESAQEEARKEKLRHVLDKFWMIVLLAITLVVLLPILGFAHDYLVEFVLGRIELEMKVDICGKLLALPLRYHRDKQRGDLLARAIGDAGRSQQAIELLFSDLLEAILMIAIGVLWLFWISMYLTLLMLIVGPLIIGVIAGYGTRIRRSARRRQVQSAEVTQRLVEILAGIKIIKAFRAERQEHHAFRSASRLLFRRSMRVVKARVQSRVFVDALNNASGVGVLLFGIVLVLSGRLSVGDLAAFSFVSATLYRPLRTLARSWSKLQETHPSAVRFFEVLDTEVEIRDAPDAVEIGRLRDAIRFRHVTFSYGREPVLRDVEFEARAGEVVALVGRTGAGKTTLVDLLLRFYDPQEGAVEIDGVDLRRVRRDALLRQVAVVTQEPFLFDGTIAENIRYGRRDASDAEVLAAAKAAYVDEFATSLPQGYDTEVGVGGTRLSGGQRQRITIARAILRDPAILILDEATSSLDSQSERILQQALEALLPGRTVFVIAHRLSTVRRADRILVLEHGLVSQSGTHEELLASGGLYRELVALQTGESLTAAAPAHPDTAAPPLRPVARA